MLSENIVDNLITGNSLDEDLKILTNQSTFFKSVSDFYKVIRHANPFTT